MRVSILDTPVKYRTSMGSGASHGAHPIFYYQRGRGKYWYFEMDGVSSVAVILREDVRAVALIRPVYFNNQLDSKLLREAYDFAHELAKQYHYRIFLRYADVMTTEFFRNQGFDLTEPTWVDGNGRDDEQFPQVLLNCFIGSGVWGYKSRFTRQSVKRASKRYEYISSTNYFPDLKMFALQNRPRSEEHYPVEDTVDGFLLSTFEFIEKRNCKGLLFHTVLDEGKRLNGIAITSVASPISNGFFLATHRTGDIATYLLAQVSKTLSSMSVNWLNVGGSESESLFRYKTSLFRRTRVRRTIIMEIQNV